jgi:hypothetical protein
MSCECDLNENKFQIYERGFVHFNDILLGSSGFLVVVVEVVEVVVARVVGNVVVVVGVGVVSMQLQSGISLMISHL